MSESHLAGPRPWKPGTFVLSLDFEMAWGWIDRRKVHTLEAACCELRSWVFDAFLTLLCRYQVSATWCTVGHLFLSECRRREAGVHPSISPPAEGWFDRDPCTSELEAPGFYGSELIKRLQESSVPQEIGCHSFCHMDYQTAPARSVRGDLGECQRVADRVRLDLRSFVFPRNRVGQLDLLVEYGYACFRGRERVWHIQHNLPNLLKMLGRNFDLLAMVCPKVWAPLMTASGLWEIPASMQFAPVHGLRRLIPMHCRIERARKGLRRAATDGGVFHLWLHPLNIAQSPVMMLRGLEAVLAEADELRRAGRLQVLTMAGVAEAADEHAQLDDARLSLPKRTR